MTFRRKGFDVLKGVDLSMQPNVQASVFLATALLLVVGLDVPTRAANQPSDSRSAVTVEQASDAASADPDQAPERQGVVLGSRSQTTIASLTIFVLAIFVGFEIITKVPPTLHTPLMSGSNAISGITLVGAVIVAGHSGGLPWLGMVAVALATINVVGGFLVTHRMLSMFIKRK